MLQAIFLVFLVVQLCTHAANSYHWPDPQIEYADLVLFEAATLFHIFVGDCDVREESTVAAQWVRIAYHDMATHNIDDGTGGLDASIAYELDRAENIGIGMSLSIGDFFNFMNPAAGLADIIAMGTVVAAAACGKLIIPFRTGRVDATKAGPPGVPEPFQDLASHTESFRRQGFNKTEMIALVACGHTLGGVRRDDFPDIIHDSSVNFTTFDSTRSFDTAIVTEYLKGSTSNPLVVGPNTTTNSDLRIFASDGNVTIQSLEPAETFRKTCSSLLERMINTVPSSVTLSDVVEPLAYKVGDTRLFPDMDGLFTFTTSIRLLSENSERKIKMFWTDRQGTACGNSGCSVQPEFQEQVEMNYLTFELRGLAHFGERYLFRAQINMTSSISRFWFEVDEGDGEVVIVDNGGSGYVIDQDSVLLDLSRSSSRLGSVGFLLTYDFVVAVRGDESSQVSVTTYETGTDAEHFQQRIETIQLVPDVRHPPSVGFTFFTGNFTGAPNHFDVLGTVGEQTFAQKFVAANAIRIEGI